MQRMNNRILSVLFACAAAAVLGGCAVRDLRRAQDDFNEAVRADNVRSVRSIGALADAQHDYEAVLSVLTEEFIRGLNPKLRGNAYAMRSIALWRTGDLENANKAAQRGLGNRPLGARDELVLQMMLPLLIDSERMAAFAAVEPDERGRIRIPEETYRSDYRPDFEDAAARLEAVTHRPPRGLAPEMRHYAMLQRWRILNNHRFVLAHTGLTPAEATALAPERDALQARISAQKEAIPPTSEIRGLIRALETQ